MECFGRIRRPGHAYEERQHRHPRGRSPGAWASHPRREFYAEQTLHAPDDRRPGRVLGIATDLRPCPASSCNAHSFYYEEMGQAGEPLVFLSGLGGDHRAFSLAQRHFSTRFRTLAFDARDAGRSDRVRRPVHDGRHGRRRRRLARGRRRRRRPTWSASRWGGWWPRSWRLRHPGSSRAWCLRRRTRGRRRGAGR